MPAVEPLIPLTSLTQGSFLRWAFTAAAYLAERQEELDALNVFPVPDGDTGTNLLRTLSSALEMLLSDSNDSAGDGRPGSERSLQSRLDELSRDALLSARGNSGVILSQLIVGLAEGIGLTRIENASQAGLGLESPRGSAVQEGARVREPRESEAHEDASVGPSELATALTVAAQRAREGVNDPVDGTILTVAEAAAEGATTTADAGGSLSQVVRAATEASLRALAGTTSQLPQLAQAGVVDAGGAGLVVILQALDDVVHRVDRRSIPLGADAAAVRAARSRLPKASGPTDTSGSNGSDGSHQTGSSATPGASGAQFEVVYHLVDVASAQVKQLEARLGELGDSIVIGGSRDRGGVRSLVTVHVHTSEPGLAVETAHEAGRPAGIRIEILTEATHASPTSDLPGPGSPQAHPVPVHALTHGTPAESPSFDLPRDRPHSDDEGLDEDRLGLLAGATGDAVADLMRETGAQVITPADGTAGEPGRLLTNVEEAIRRTRCATVLVLPGRPEGAVAAQAAAVRANADGITVVVADTRSPVQALAALSVFDADADPETEARRLADIAEAVRCGSVEVATRASTFAAGRCRRGDLLAYAEGDVRAVGPDVMMVAKALVEHLLAPRGERAEPPELVTLVAGQGHLVLAETLAGQSERGHPDLEVVAIEGGQHDSVLLVGVE